MDQPATSRSVGLLWALVPVLVVAGSLGANHRAPAGGQLLVAVLAGGAGASVWMAARRPRPAVLANGIAVATYFALGLNDGPIFLTVPLVGFVAAQRTRPGRLLPAAVPALGLVVAGLLARMLLHGAGYFASYWQALGVCALSVAACSVGWWLRDRTEVRAEQARHTVTEERLRMAQDLHDGVGHGLAVIAMQAGVALHLLEKETGTGPHPVKASLEAIRDTSRASLDALRTELARMSGQPAPWRPAPGLPDLPALVGRVRAGGLDVDLRCETDAVGEEVGEVVYAVAQEALTNVLRHADARRAEVAVRQEPGRLLVTVSDDGRVATPGAVQPGMGISGMRTRVQRLGGSLDAVASPSGFVLRVVVPLDGTGGGS